MHLDTTERKSIRPEPGPEETRYRFDWNSPLQISHHDPQTIYYGGNRLFISKNRGDEWARTKDLTRQIDRDELQIMGHEVDEDTLSRNDGISSFGQIITLSESPLEEGLIYVGTDDGNLQVSRDGGETWKNVADRLSGVPDGTYVSRVVASEHAGGRERFFADGGPWPLFIRIARLGGSFDSFTEAPTPEQLARIDALEGEVKELVDQLQTVVEGDVPSLNQALLEAGVAHIRLDGELPRRDGGNRRMP